MLQYRRVCQDLSIVHPWLLVAFPSCSILLFQLFNHDVPMIFPFLSDALMIFRFSQMLSPHEPWLFTFSLITKNRPFSHIQYLWSSTAWDLGPHADQQHSAMFSNIQHPSWSSCLRFRPSCSPVFLVKNPSGSDQRRVPQRRHWPPRRSIWLAPRAGAAAAPASLAAEGWDTAKRVEMVENHKKTMGKWWFNVILWHFTFWLIAIENCPFESSWIFPSNSMVLSILT